MPGEAKVLAPSWWQSSEYVTDLAAVKFDFSVEEIHVDIQRKQIIYVTLFCMCFMYQSFV